MIEDIQAVKTLTIPTVDKTRKFDGISALKINKKDRHMKRLHEFSKFVEVINEEVVQEVLKLTREQRETLEVQDEDLQKFYTTINEDHFLIERLEPDLFIVLEELKVKIATRSAVIQTFAVDLDNTETKRADVVGKELKQLVDDLIAIAHQLPDDIEHIVEAEAFELNTEIIANRKEHANKVAGLQIAQVKIEAEGLNKWEESRVKWRKLRHDQAVKQFTEQMTSTEYTDPDDRQLLMRKFRDDQGSRRQLIEKELAILRDMNDASISSEVIAHTQNRFLAINEMEVAAIQTNYNELNELKASLKYKAEERVEALRQELHMCGCLKVDPNLKEVADWLQIFIDDDSLSELWRLGGSLKSELQCQIADLCCDEVIYERVIAVMEDRLEVILSSFPLKGIMEERGRLAQLEKMRNGIAKMRTSPRSEIPAVLRGLHPELLEVLEFEGLPENFTQILEGITCEMAGEISQMESRLASTAGTMRTDKTSTKSLDKSMVSKKGTLSKSMTMKSRKAEKDSVVAAVDPMLLKVWNQKLGTLFYGSDLPVEAQQACLETLERVRQMRQCNELVDEVVLLESDTLLKKIEYRYKRLIENIANFLETQASLMLTTTANIGHFFFAVAKMVESHKKLQADLDEKFKDATWDLKEEFRLELEDREEMYQEACQKIRESTKTEELDQNFEEVLRILGEIQQSYRTYHNNACFVADKYPLILIDEFRKYITDLCRKFFKWPQESHPILTEYERIFDQVMRLNKAFFQSNPDAAGFPRMPPLPPLPVKEGAGNEGEEVEGEELPELEEYLSPFLQNEQQKANANAGKFFKTLPFPKIAEKFFTDSYFAPPEPPEEGKGAEEVKDGEEGGGPEIEDVGASLFPSTTLRRDPHPACPWMAVDTKSLPLSEEELEKLDEDEIEDYERALAKDFINLEAIAEADGLTPESALDGLEPEQIEQYKATAEKVTKIKERLKLEADPAYILANPPQDPSGNSWVATERVTEAQIEEMFDVLCDRLVASLESESCKRIAFSENECDKRKKDYTDELEDRIRNHWPRRGRVETQIKQPREAELLGHKEKTWRHIQNIQQRMIELNRAFEDNCDMGKRACEEYVKELTTLRNLLLGDFKNLASLQGIDVRARSATISFQSSCANQISTLNQMSGPEAESIVSFANDFRKVCPPQVPGVEGGYSESEIQEIAALVEEQCEEIGVVVEEWKQVVVQLEEEQQQCLKCQEEFNERYKKCTQDVAMSEGLGQKYGAPRRRAQERLRTEVSRDEGRAGKIDELLAQIEFQCSEAHRMQNIEDEESIDAVSSVSSLISSASKALDQFYQAQMAADKAASVSADLGLGNDALKSRGQMELRWSNSSWFLLMQVRLLLLRRATYLKVLDEKTSPPTELIPLPWIPEQRQALCMETAKDLVPEQADSFVLPVAKALSEMEAMPPIPGIDAVFEEIDTICRKETRELYESEGLSDALGEGGVPESLSHWLAENKVKTVGKGGYRERAWKRLWAQVFRYETLLARHLEPTDSKGTGAKYRPKLGAPATCLQSLTNAFILFACFDKENRMRKFSKLVKVWDKSREKNERLLRPRLGSPDAIDELTELDSVEQGRSSELVENTKKVRSLIIRSQTEHFVRFVEDACRSTESLLKLLDSTLRQDHLEVPPDTVIPKKHMTLKKLRKAQRIREEVAQGGEDRSQRRKWAGVALQEMLEAVKFAESLVHDLDAAPAGSPREPPTAPEKRDKKKGAAEVPVEKPVPSLLPPGWAKGLEESSSVEGQVSTAHRIIVKEREEAVQKYCAYYMACVEEIRVEYDRLLTQEESWNQRWRKQVLMLRGGKF